MEKNRFFALAVAALAFFSSCEETDKDNPENENSNGPVAFILKSTQLTFDCAGGTQNLELSAPGPWTVKVSDGTESWCSVSPSEGDGSATLAVTVAEIPDEDLDRDTRVMVTCNGLTLTANIFQTANPDTFIVTPDQVKVGALGGDFEINVLSRSREYDVTIVDEWISQINGNNAVSGEWTTLRFHAANNPSSEARSGVVSICTKDGSCIPVMVDQTGVLAEQGNVLGMRFTATWCGYCPYMDEAFHKVAEEDPNFVYVTFHASKGYPLYFKDCEPLVKAYKIDGYPTGIIGGWKVADNFTDIDYSAKKIEATISDFKAKFPCVAHISVAPGISGNTLTVNAEVTAAVTSYKVVALVLESNIIEAQSYYPTTGGSQKISNYSHDNIARKLLTETITGDACNAEAGKPQSFSWSTELDSSWNAANLSVLVWVYADYGDLISEKAKRTFPDNFVTNAVIANLTR